MLLGCIADDFTGATDLANNLVRTGLRVVQTIGVPADASAAIDDDAAVDAAVDAIVIALKSRTIAAAQAVEQSLAALHWLRARGAGQIYFKVCSTFDSTERGNIGPVVEALMEAIGCDFAPVCPAFPQAGRTVYKSHLFVGELLLSDSGMRQHPLTPMTDANLVRVLQAQCRGPVGAIEHAVVAQGPAAIGSRIADLRAQGVRLAIVDAIADADLMAMGRAFAALPLLVAGSGVAIGLAQNHGIAPAAAAARLPAARGALAIVCGSCSTASNAQVERFIDSGGAVFAVDPLRLGAGDDVVGEALAFCRGRLGDAPLLVYASAAPERVAAVQRELGVERSGALVEAALAAIALGLVRAGVRQLVVAGGETSGACVQALGIERMRIGAQIDPGVPWCHAACDAAGPGGLHLALKSGNFGTPDFFCKAFEVLA